MRINTIINRVLEYNTRTIYSTPEDLPRLDFGIL